MTEEERCRHPDCIYRRKTNAINEDAYPGQCKYIVMTGHSRIAGLPPQLQLPCNCRRYVPDGSQTPKPDTGGWRDEALALYEAGATDGEIADALGLRRDRIQKWRHLELKKAPNKDQTGKNTKFDWQRARELYNRGLSDVQIAQELGCSVASVWSWRYKYELFPNRERKGEGI